MTERLTQVRILSKQQLVVLGWTHNPKQITGRLKVARRKKERFFNLKLASSKDVSIN